MKLRLVALLLWLLPVATANAFWQSRDSNNNNTSLAGPPAPWIHILPITAVSAASGSPTLLTSTADAPVGSTIVVAVNMNANLNQGVAGCTDNASGGSNTYTVLQASPTSGVYNAAFCYAVNTTHDLPAGSQWTVTTVGGTNSYVLRGAWYITGYNGGVDQSAAVNGASGTAVAGLTTATLANIADQAIGYANVNNSTPLITESPLFTNLDKNTFNIIGYDAVTSTAALSYAPTWSGGTSGPYSAVLLTFLPTGAGGGCPTATTLIAKLDGGQNTSAVTNAVCNLVNDGVWAKLDALYVYAINSATNARLNWVSTSFNLTINGACTFTANAGYTGNTTNCYQATGFTPSTAAGHWVLNSASIGACDLTSRTTGTFHYMMGTNSDPVNSTTWAAIGDAIGSSAISYGVNQGFVNATQTNVQGTWMASRETSILTTFYHNGTSVSSTSQVSGALSANALTLMALDGSSISSFNPDQFAYFFYGAGLTPGDIANLHNRMHTYLSAVGAPAGC